MASTSTDEINELAKHLPPSLGFVVFWARRIRRLVDTDATRTVALGLGLLHLAYALYSILLWVWRSIRPSRLNIYCHAETGSWALVTGASDGIGRAFAEELLARGFNVLLHGRNQPKLHALQQSLQARFPHRTLDHVVADAARPDHPEQTVLERVHRLPGKLTVLVNNVGGIHQEPLFLALDHLTPHDLSATINCNLRFPTLLTAALLPTLKSTQPSLILNCGSFGGVVACPYITTYTATKAYIHNFTEGLRRELLAEGFQPVLRPEVRGIEVMGLVIGNVLSRSNKEEMPYFTISAGACARGALRRVGSGKALECVSWRQALLFWVMQCLPARTLDGITVDTMRRRVELERAKGKSD
ncbi:putative steroid dehydrogenase 4 [Teratosphaeria destructans]|uniref:Steroid dehydrogenase 4 n=1 Tax=Teratosphaeria destructans TaxID=418781 RepID=A0A9W7SNH2_9PEZI|nr:putative steroid dehydrogenase 4 [Teratosphaeria destructans]